MDPLQHFLSVGDLILARLNAGISDLKKVDHAADLAGVKNSTQVTPAVYAVLTRMHVQSKIPGSAKTAWAQDWTTVVVTRSAKSPKSGAGARELAGPICSSLINLLAGWTPAQFVLPLEAIAPAAPPLLVDSGTWYIPLTWRATFTSFN